MGSTHGTYLIYVILILELLLGVLCMETQNVCILETESLSSSNRDSQPVPDCWPHHHNHEDNVIENFTL